MYFTKYMKDYLNYDGLAVMAHRGGSLEAPENTIESFKYSLEIGSDIIETDIQLSSDGVPYIFHDDDLKRILGIHKNFNELLSSEIDELNIFGDYKIPTLEETLKQFPNTRFQIDFKTDEVVDPAIEIINKFPDIKKNLCFASFSSRGACFGVAPNVFFSGSNSLRKPCCVTLNLLPVSLSVNSAPVFNPNCCATPPTLGAF